MGKVYRVVVDVTMSGDLHIVAESKEKAIEIAKSQHFLPCDLRWFHFLSSDVFDVEEVEEEDESNA